MTPRSESYTPIPVSVCLPVLNEEHSLPACLEDLHAFPEIVVVDSGSTDRTAAVAMAAGATVLQFRWDGGFPKKRNWALRNYRFSQPWVLFLDADERVSPAFAMELQRLLPSTSHSGFWLSYTNWFLGRPLHHGDRMRKLALFRVGAGEYERFPEDSWSALDMEVHEHPIISGTIGEIKTPLAHLDQRGLHSYLSKHNEYSSWEARRFLWLQSADHDSWAVLNPRQRFKYRHLDKWWLTWIYWLAAIFLKRGFLDGRPGWVLASLKRRYFAEIRLKILESSSPH